MTRLQKEEAIVTMKQCGMYKFFRAVMWIEREILRLDVNTDIAEPHERAGRMVLREMLKGGNFGKQYNHQGRGIIGYYAKQVAYNMQYVLEFPSEPMSRPFTLIWDYSMKRIMPSYYEL